jgi:hypothetical protein
MKKASALWMHKLPAGDGVAWRAEEVDNLPDSTYTYYNGVLHRAMRIKYNEEGWVTLEKGLTDFDYGGFPDDDMKTEYAYTREGDLLVQEAITYLTPYVEGVWVEFHRTVNYFNARRIPVKTYSYYPDGNGGWELSEISGTVEYDEKGNPTVIVDSVPGSQGMRAYARFEVAYDELDRIAGFNTFFTGGTDEWREGERIVVTYDENGNRLDMHYELGASCDACLDNTSWTFTYLVETLYDERGNIVAETEKSLDDAGEYRVEWSDTYRHVYLPDRIAPVADVPSGSASTVYQSPSGDGVTVSLLRAEQAVVTLTGLSGQTVVKQIIGRQGVIDLHMLPRGIYILTVKSANGTDAHKLFVK